MIFNTRWWAVALIAITLNPRLNAENRVVFPPPSALTYADVADLSSASTIAAHVRIKKAERIKLAPSEALPVDQKRFLITADVVALIRGADGLPPQIRYLVDVKNDQKGKTPQLKKAEMMVFGVAVPNHRGELQLVAPDGQVAMTAALGDQVRAILAAQASDAAPPRILGVGDAFHVPGVLSGQGETQIFLVAGDGRPVSLSIWREPGLAPRWAVSLSEIVDQAAAPPARDTLLWYRLACFLPKTLPNESVAALEPASAQIAGEDYQFILAGLGRCDRTRAP